eukprot:TRINITY_DN738_c0_g1_i2.p2 TRINITY_DN738_c0_g1~~TRINITY_DN738_c0_g1_i2.p2  ORF type:complete len:111 (-),score=1.27 TRINITY_DN738_c0_g1_i2:70-378(-)
MDPVRLSIKGTFIGYKRSKVNQYCNTALVRLEGVEDKKDATFYLGKRLAYAYKTPKGVKKTIFGKVTRTHGNSGVVRAKFATNLPSQAMGCTIRCMMFPSRV